MKRLLEGIAGWAFMVCIYAPWALWKNIRGKTKGDWVP